MAVADIAEVDQFTEEAQSDEVMPPRRRFTREEYYRAAEVGIIGPEERLELIDGEIIQKMAPQLWPHSFSVTRSAKVLERAFGEGFFIQQEKPLPLRDDTEPEPDIAVIHGSLDDYSDHPIASDAVLVMEIADSSIPYDKGIKASLYASANIPEYWLLDVKRNVLEVRREPRAEPNTRFEHGYRLLMRVKASEVVSPLSAPNAEIKVSDLLPNIPIQETE
jgi:Uma2 family endonuclease